METFFRAECLAMRFFIISIRTETLRNYENFVCIQIYSCSLLFFFYLGVTVDCVIVSSSVDDKWLLRYVNIVIADRLVSQGLVPVNS